MDPEILAKALLKLEQDAVKMNIDPKLEDVIRGMVNCYHTCGENFENTVGMVARNRGLAPNQVKQILGKIKDEFPDIYQRYRVKLPQDFPF